MSKSPFTHTVRDAIATLLGYPPVIQPLITRRLEDRVWVSGQ